LPSIVIRRLQIDSNILFGQGTISEVVTQVIMVDLAGNFLSTKNGEMRRGKTGGAQEDLLPLIDDSCVLGFSGIDVFLHTWVSISPTLDETRWVD
ncbi:hypothetical protein CCACVL1_09641, partial [Corchorus capsularis]